MKAMVFSAVTVKQFSGVLGKVKAGSWPSYASFWKSFMDMMPEKGELILYLVVK